MARADCHARLGVLKLALHKGKGTALPEEWAGVAQDLELK